MLAEEIARSFWLQFGALGLFSVTGWIVAWQIWREHRKQLPQVTEALLEGATAMTHLATLIQADRGRGG